MLDKIIRPLFLLPKRETIIGRFNPKLDNMHLPFSVLTAHACWTRGREAWVGVNSSGEEYHVYAEHWDWVPSAGGHMTDVQILDESIRMKITLRSAPVEIDERARFEKAVIDKAEHFHPNLEQYGEHPEAEYRDPKIEWAWGLWQARSALARKP